MTFPSTLEQFFWFCAPSDQPVLFKHYSYQKNIYYIFQLVVEFFSIGIPNPVKNIDS